MMSEQPRSVHSMLLEPMHVFARMLVHPSIPTLALSRPALTALIFAIYGREISMNRTKQFSYKQSRSNTMPFNTSIGYNTYLVHIHTFQPIYCINKSKTVETAYHTKLYYTCWLRTDSLSIERTSTLSSLFRRYLFTPTITSSHGILLLLVHITELDHTI